MEYWFSTNFNSMQKTVLLHEEVIMWQEWLGKMSFARARRVAATYYTRVDARLTALVQSIEALRARMLWHLRAPNAVSCISRHFRRSISDPSYLLARWRLRREWCEMLRELHSARVQEPPKLCKHLVTMFVDCEYGLLESSEGSQVLLCSPDRPLHACVSHLTGLLEKIPVTSYELQVRGSSVTLRGLDDKQRKKLCALWEPERHVRWADMI